MKSKLLALHIWVTVTLEPESARYAGYIDTVFILRASLSRDREAFMLQPNSRSPASRRLSGQNRQHSMSMGESGMSICFNALFALARALMVLPDSGYVEDQFLVSHFISIVGRDSLFYAITPENKGTGEKYGLASLFVLHSARERKVILADEYPHYSKIKYWIGDLSKDGVSEVVAIAEDEAQYGARVYRPSYRNGKAEIQKVFSIDGLWLPDKLVRRAFPGDTERVSLSPIEIGKSSEGLTILTLRASTIDDEDLAIELRFDKASGTFRVAKKTTRLKEVLDK